MVSLLAIDTATRRGSVAWLDGDEVRGASWLDDAHGSALAPAVAQLLGPSLAGIEGVALSIGPGSFTGLRIGLAFVKGLSLARTLPTIAVSTLELLAASAGGDEVLAVIDARNREVFARLAAAGVEDGLYGLDALVARLAGRAPSLIAGDPPSGVVAALPGWSLATGPAEPLAATLARLARGRWLAGEGRDPASLQPSYGQPAAVDRPRHAVDTPSSPT